MNYVTADDNRTLDVEWNNNYMVAAFNAAAGTSLDAAAHWIEFNTGGPSPVVMQQGFIHP